jgi:peptidoglycan/LPS O-acetylase OafA/YrhL
MTYLVGGALAQSIVGHPAFALLSTALGSALAAWGAVTRVRRRAVFGAATVALSIVLLIGVPLAGLLPRVRGAALWMTIAAVGLVAIVAAAQLERGRTRLRRVVQRLHDLTVDWA